MTRTLKEQINRERKRRVHFWGVLVSMTSILYGNFILANRGYLLQHSESYFQGIPEQVFGYGLLILGALKLIGVLLNHKSLRKWGIIGLSSLWSALFILSFTYSFGTGYPHPSWIFSLTTVVSCWRISLKGEFDGL